MRKQTWVEKISSLERRLPPPNLDNKLNPTLGLFDKADSFPILYVDAGTSGNGNYGHQKTRICVTNEHGRVLLDEFVGDLTNNQGEILAIVHALMMAEKSGKKHIIKSDSRTAVGWTLKGRGDGKSLRAIKKAHELLKTTGSKIEWISRNFNLAGHHLEKRYRI